MVGDPDFRGRPHISTNGIAQKSSKRADFDAAFSPKGRNLRPKPSQLVSAELAQGLLIFGQTRFQRSV
jgi:hypothetical protein